MWSWTRRKMPPGCLPKLLLVCLSAWLLHYFGVFLWLLERDLDGGFRYPLEGDVSSWVDALEQQGEVTPASVYAHQYDFPFVWSARDKCRGPGNESQDLRLLFLVKSAPEHLDRRDAIRQSWGFERRFSDVPVRRVFLVGRRPEDIPLQRRLDFEHAKHGDLVQADFYDSYFNNTVKSMMGLRWALQFCPGASFILLCDDDMYVSLKNLLRFLRDPVNYPEYLQRAFEIPANGRWRRQVPDTELPDDSLLYAGFVFESRPHRHRSSKWFVSLSEWPYSRWPPYVTAGAVVLSRHSLRRLYLASLFTKTFRFDDIYLALLAKRAGVPPFHCPNFHFWKLPYDVHAYRYVVVSHGYHDPKELTRVWHEQRSAGNA